MALSKTVHLSDRNRFVKIILVILEELTPLLQDILQNEILPDQIHTQVSRNNQLSLQLRKEQMTLIQNARNDGYKKFDITLTYTLLRNLKCVKITAPTKGWGISQMPGNGETTPGDDIEIIRLIRNTVLGHAAVPSMSETEFRKHWSNFEGICKRLDILLSRSKKYLDSLLNAEIKAIDPEAESIYIKKMKDISSAEKLTRELLQEALTSRAQIVRIEARNSRKRKIAETFTDTSISILNDMKNCITETTSDSEIEELYELIEEFVGGNEEDAVKLTSSPFFKRLEGKIKKYANLRPNKMHILARHLRFVLKLKKNYGVDVEISRGSLQLKYTFSSEKGHDLFMQDLQRGEIGKLVLSMLYYPPYLASFGLQAEDLTVHLIDNTKINVPLSHKTGFSTKQISSITVLGVDDVSHISVVKSYILWVSNEIGRLLQVDSAGHVLHDKLRTVPFLAGSHTVTEDEDLLFRDDHGEVSKLTSDGTVTTFLIKGREVLCIHSSRINGDILVGSFDGRVTRYDKTGRLELQVIEMDDKGQRLYKHLMHITENQNGDIWTSDLIKLAVVVVDKSGSHRFDYTGRQSVDTDYYTGRQSPFFPRAICTDVLGHVLVCDEYNHSVHLLDQDGQFLSLLLTNEQHGIRHPTAVCVDDQHNLYLGHRDSNTINVYKYLRDTDVK